jgi:hypothetical protein
MPTDIESAVCSLNWEVDGREVFETQDYPTGLEEKLESPRGLTRRIHLTWNNNRLKDSYLVFVASGKRFTESDADRAWNPSLLFLGREIGRRGNIQARVKSWIDLCQDKHRGPCLTPRDHVSRRFQEMLSHSYFGVIDVLNMQLTELPAHRASRGSRRMPQYVALSYVWGDSGDTHAYKTVLENAMQHRMHGGLDRVFHSLPKVIQDAIDLVRRLGFQYLWIDALCIIQDSARSWKLNAYNMDLIYGNAVFTICAADGPGASTGLLAMDEYTGTGSKDQLIADCTEDVRLVVSRPPEMYIKSSKWNTRAWTFQERLLSRRCLIFTGSRVYFQCRSTGMSEDIYADREGAGWSLDFMDAPLQTFRQLPLRSIWVYMKSVELYTARELTKEEDILAAFSGVSNLMQETMLAPFVFGLPTSHFDLALLWEHFEPVQRRKTRSDATADDSAEFPSWSWSGWVGAATHYRRDMIEDCFDNVTEWLAERTWIRWHIRDGNGDLCPLWDRYDWQMDLSEHENWQGYGYDRASGSMTFWAKARGRRSTVITRESGRPSPVIIRDGPRRVSRDYPLERRAVDIRSTSPSSSSLHSDSDISVSFHENRSHARGEPRRDTPRRYSIPRDDADTDHNHTRSRGLPPPRDIVDHDGNVSWQQQQPLPPPPKHTSSTQPPRPTPPMDQVSDPARLLASNDRAITRQVLSRWSRAAYRNEILRFLADICLAIFRLVKFMLGIPPGSLSTDRRRPSQQIVGPIPFPQSATYPGRVPQNYRSSEPTYGHMTQAYYEPTQYYGSATRPAGEVSGYNPSYYPPPPPPPPPPGQHLVPPNHQVMPQMLFVPPRVPPTPNIAAQNSFDVGRDRQGVRFTERYDDESGSLVDLRRNQTDQNARTNDDWYGNAFPRTTKSPRRHSTFSRAKSRSAEKRKFHDLAFEPDARVEPEQTEIQPSFQITLKEYPYQPAVAPFDPKLGDSNVPVMPILQFWTWHTYLHVQTPSSAATGLIRCNLADKFGDWCGSIILDARWVGSAKTAKQEFIAISEAKKFTEEECGTWSYYVPKEREESEWDLFYVLLIAWSDGRWERVGLGKAFKEAFRDAIWKEIVLA